MFSMVLVLLCVVVVYEVLCIVEMNLGLRD